MDLPQPPSGGAGDFLASERRNSPRHPYQRKALCQEGLAALNLSPEAAVNKADDIWLMGTSQDLSAGGISFILHRRFDPGTLLTIELERPKRCTWGQLPARVLHATPQPDGYWRLGCALVIALSEEELRGWINDLHAMVAARQ